MTTKLTQIFEGVELSEEVKSSIAESFEQAVNETVEEKVLELDEKYKNLTEEYCAYLAEQYEDMTEEYIKEEVMPTISKYVDHVSEEFIKENQLAIDTGLKVEIAESFLSGIKTISEQFNIKVPETDISERISELEEKLDTANKKLDSVITENTELEKQILENKKENIVREVVSDSLTESQVEKLNESIKTITFIDEDQYRNSVKEIKESIFPKGVDVNDPVKKEPITEVNKTPFDNYLARL